MAHVLLVDDHPDLVEILRQLLEARGHTVECCPTAEEALQRLPTARPGVLICDQRLPGMSGLELLRALQGDAGQPSVPVILCSADDSLMDQAREAGAMDFWVKGSEQLFEHVDRLAQRLSADARSSPR